MLTIPDRMARLGLELLGHGDAALVWARAGSPFVVKVGYDGADGWPAWAAWCMAHPGPHVPVVHACHEIEHDGHRQGFVAIVERLHRSTVVARLIADDRRLKRDPRKLARLLEAAYPGVAAMLRRAAAAFPDAQWDLAPSNWLARCCGTPVLMDPLARA